MHTTRNPLEVASTECLRRGERETPAKAAAPTPTPSGNIAFLRPPVEADEIGRLGNYRVLRLLGRGGMALVFLAEDLGLRRPVALKVMKPDLGYDTEAWQRFLREARLMASIQHDHLVTVYQVGEEGKVIYLAMEALQGETLADWLRRVGRPALPDILRLGREICAGLDVIHRHGLVHRDIKPANIWLESGQGDKATGRQGADATSRVVSVSPSLPDSLSEVRRVKILDFGLARAIKDDVHFTQSGYIIGTPAFMSPEQGRGAAVDGRTDLFSLGCVLYNLCTGVLPFQADNTMGLLTELATSDPRPVHHVNGDVPRILSRLVMQLLAKDPDARPASAAEVGNRLKAIEAQLNACEPLSSGGSRRPLSDDPISLTEVIAPDSGRRTRSKKNRLRKKGKSRRSWGVLAASILTVCACTVLLMFVAARLSQQGTAGVSGAQAFLSDWQPSEAVNWIKMPPHLLHPEDFAGKGPLPPFRGVEVQGRIWPHGIFMHPPLEMPGVTRLSYRLDKKFRSFEAGISINDGPPESATPLLFTVEGDGRPLWTSRPLRSQVDSQKCHVPVEGVAVLTLEVNCPGDSHGAHAVWIDPCVRR